MYSNKMLVIVMFIVLVLAVPFAVASDDLDGDVADSGVGLKEAGSVESSNPFGNKLGTGQLPDDNTSENVVRGDVGSSRNIIITNETFDTYFTDKYLNDEVSDGDVLDFRGNFFGNQYSMYINKAVNITSSTRDAYVYLNTSANDWFGGDDVAAFTIVNSGAYTNVSHISFYNSQIFVKNSHHIIFNNISAVVEASTVGRGVGQTSIRDNSSFVTVENSTFSTRDQWGGCGLVLAWANNCTIRYNKLIGIGEVGNLFYLTTFNVEADMPRDEKGNLDYNLINVNNTFENNLLIGPDHPQAMCYVICLSGTNNRIVNNTVVNYTGNGISVQAYSFDYDMKTLIANNTLLGSNFFMPNGSYAINNTVTGNFSMGARSIVENNTVTNVKMIYDNLVLSNTKVDNIIINTDKRNLSIINCTVTGNITIKASSLVESPANVTIRDSTIGGYLLVNGSRNISIINNTIAKQIIIDSRNNMNNNMTISDNTIVNDENYTIRVNKKVRGLNITGNYLMAGDLAADNSIYLGSGSDDYIIRNGMKHILLNDSDYHIYFNEDGSVREAILSDEAVIELTGNLYDKSFLFTEGNLSIINPYNFTLYNTTIAITREAHINIDGLEIIDTIHDGKIISIDNASDTTITNTSIKSNAGAIVINGSKNIQIRYNDIRVTADYTIDVTNSLNAEVSYNSLQAKTRGADESVNVENSLADVHDNKGIITSSDNYILCVDTTEFIMGSQARISASIRYDDIPGSIVSDINTGKMVFKINGKTLKDSSFKVIYAKVINGIATIENYTIPDTWDRQNITIEAVYSGSSQYKQLRSNRTNITVTTTTPMLLITDISTTQLSRVTFTANLTAADRIISTGKVVFKINGKTVKDANGKIIYAKVVNNTASIEYELSESIRKGDYNITVIYSNADEKIEASGLLHVD